MIMQTIEVANIEIIAADLLSEHGENPEYDRALIELVATARGLSPADHREDVEARLRLIALRNVPRGHCRHCGRSIVSTNEGVWIDPEATGDDSVWSEVCDAHDTFLANHEPTA